MKIKKELKGLRKSFTFAIRGIKSCILNERNMRIHIVVMSFVILFSLFYNLSKSEYILLLLTFSSVIACEMMNTALETTVDLISTSYNKLAQIAKDVAAGAVLVSTIFAIIIGLILFLDIKIFTEIANFFMLNPILLLFLLILIVLSLIFIFKGISNTNYKGKK